MKLKYIIATSLILGSCETGISSYDTPNSTIDAYEEDAEESASIEPGDDNESNTESSSDNENLESEDSAEPSQEGVLDDEGFINFSQLGIYSTSIDSRSVSVTNCADMDYKVYSPTAVVSPPVVILGHGFARGPEVMYGWAEHISTWGVEVLVPALCHYNILSGVDHEMNGQNMIELGLAHGATNIVYAGHSAGGLAAIIAASQDPSSAGILGLDATDTQDVPGVDDFIGRDYAPGVVSPAFSISGESSSCNSNNNGVELFKMMTEFNSVKVTSADHCDFESPTNWLCNLNCSNETYIFSDEELRPIITALGTAAIISLSGVSSEGYRIWSEDGLNSWIDAGAIQIIE